MSYGAAIKRMRLESGGAAGARSPTAKNDHSCADDVVVGDHPRYHAVGSSQSRFPQMRLILSETTNIRPMKQTQDGNLKISISISWIKGSRGSDTIFDPTAFNLLAR